MRQGSVNLCHYKRQTRSSVFTESCKAAFVHPLRTDLLDSCGACSGTAKSLSRLQACSNEPLECINAISMLGSACAGLGNPDRPAISYNSWRHVSWTKNKRNPKLYTQLTTSQTQDVRNPAKHKTYLSNLKETTNAHPFHAAVLRRAHNYFLCWWCSRIIMAQRQLHVLRGPLTGLRLTIELRVSLANLLTCQHMQQATMRVFTGDR